MRMFLSSSTTRSLAIKLVLRRLRQSHRKAGSLAELAVDKDAPTMCSNYFLGDSKTEPCGTRLGTVDVPLSKTLKEMFTHLWRNSRSGIADAQAHPQRWPV